MFNISLLKYYQEIEPMQLPSRVERTASERKYPAENAQ